MIVIDGSKGEGGGQMLRTSLSLSCITGAAFRMVGIRKSRKKPGLMPQHLTGVRAMKEISQAVVSGDVSSSMELTFQPSRVSAGAYAFDIGTAGSVSLLLQTLLPPLLLADGPSTLNLTGGTHVPFSPVYDYIQEVFFPMLNHMGISVHSSIKRYGFYPKGGGRISVEVGPVKEIKPIRCFKDEHPLQLSGTSGVANLPITIAQRQIRSAKQCLADAGFDAVLEPRDVPSPSAGTFLFLRAEKGYPAGFSSLGERGKRAETVGREACLQLLPHLATGSCFDPHLSDQIVLYLALARSGSVFSTSRVTNHLITNLEVIEKFIDISWSVDVKEGRAGNVRIEPK